MSRTPTKLTTSPILWSSKQEESVSLSTTESEFIAATEDAKDALWLSLFYEKLKLPFKSGNVFIDNVSALKNSQFRLRTNTQIVHSASSKKSYAMCPIPIEQNQFFLHPHRSTASRSTNETTSPTCIRETNRTNQIETMSTSFPMVLLSFTVFLPSLHAAVYSTYSDCSE